MSTSKSADAGSGPFVLYDNPFSPFTRKVRMVPRYKRAPFRSIDALALRELPQLARLNPRAEVPVLVDGAIVVLNSADSSRTSKTSCPSLRCFVLARGTRQGAALAAHGRPHRRCDHPRHLAVGLADAAARQEWGLTPF